MKFVVDPDPSEKTCNGKYERSPSNIPGSWDILEVDDLSEWSVDEWVYE